MLNRKRQKRGAVTKEESRMVNVWIPTIYLPVIDKVADALDLDRSKFIRAAIREKSPAGFPPPRSPILSWRVPPDDRSFFCPEPWGLSPRDFPPSGGRTMNEDQSKRCKEPTMAETANIEQAATDPVVAGSGERIIQSSIGSAASPQSVWSAIIQSLQRGYCLWFSLAFVVVHACFSLFWLGIFIISLLCLSDSLKNGNPPRSSLSSPNMNNTVATNQVAVWEDAAPVKNWISWLAVIAVFQVATVVCSKEAIREMERKTKEWQAEREEKDPDR